MFRSGAWRAAFVCALVVYSVSVTAQRGPVRINVVTNATVNDAMLASLAQYGQVREVISEINAVLLQARLTDLPAIQALPFVEAANPDAERMGGPVDTVAAQTFAGGVNTWNLDAVNVTDLGVAGRTVTADGTGVYVAVLDSGLLDSWRQYFPQERIATQFAKAFAGLSEASAAEPTNQWEHDTNSHGTHVTSSIIGYSLGGTPINGVAPNAKIIPVKVLNQNGSGWSSMIARGIVYVTDLKASGALGSAPLVINMSLGGSVLDAVEQAAIDYAISNGVVVVAAAGNEGEAGMSYPGAYAPVISVAAAGWRGQWSSGNWFVAGNVPDPSDGSNFYIADFSSRAKKDQDLDVVAPGSWVVGPYQLQRGKTSYFYVSGTSQATPHVSGIVALMLQKDATLSSAQVEAFLESSAIEIPVPPGGCVGVIEPGAAAPVQQCWGADATGHGLATADEALGAIGIQ
jgi:subtilisin family serine protease